MLAIYGTIAQKDFNLDIVVPYDQIATGDDVRINGKACERIIEPTHGPLLIEHKEIRLGRPVSLYDLLAVSLQPGLAAQPYTRYVPADRDFSRPYTHITTEYVLVKTLHAEYMAQQHWRGRPSAFTKFRFEDLVSWRDAIFQGTLTIRELARRAGVSEPAAARFAHGETLWYI